MKKVLWHAEKKAYSLYLCEMFCKYLLGPFDLEHMLAPIYLYLVFIVDDLTISESEMLNEDSPYQCMRVNI